MNVGSPRLLWIWALLLAGTLAWDASGIDLRVMQYLGSANGFALRNHPWLSLWLHDWGRQLATVLYVAVVTMVLVPLGPWRRLPLRDRLEPALAVTLALLAINAIKRHSLTSCPWDLHAFGGIAQYVSHWHWGLADGGSGRCFPGGHASGTFALMGAATPWLRATSPVARRLGWSMLWGSALLGLVFGVAQTLRGAHYPSHTLWTALICGACIGVTAWCFHGVRAVLTALRSSDPSP